MSGFRCQLDGRSGRRWPSALAEHHQVPGSNALVRERAVSCSGGKRETDKEVSVTLLDGLSVGNQPIRIGRNGRWRVQFPLSRMPDTTISRKDWKFMEQAPYGDPNFSEEHNRRVIAEVDTWNDAMDRERSRIHKEKIRERTDAVGAYLRNITQGKGVHSIDQYFGRRHLAYLRGEEVVRQLKANPALVEKLKNSMSKKGTLSPL